MRRPTSPSSSPLLFAAADHRFAQGRRFGIWPADLLRHVHVIGQTGAGKSVLLEQLIVAAIREGMGVGLLDPHGDLANRVLDFIPSHRTNDLVLVDGTDTQMPVGWNPLDSRDARSRPLVVSGVLAVFRKVFGEFWGPRLEHVFRNVLAALLETRDATLIGVLRMLAEEDFRRRILAHVQDPLVRYFWEREFSLYSPGLRAEVASPVQNKVAAALTNPILRNILGQVRSTFSIADIMNDGGIFVANLAKGLMGQDASNLLGSLLLGDFQLAAYARVDQLPDKRRPFLLVVDEFPSFATDALGEMLVEARKFKLGIILAHQNLAQIDEPLRRAVLGNTGTTVVFRVGPEDAEQIARLFSPVLTAEDLTRLAKYQIGVRLAVGGTTTEPFTATTLDANDKNKREGRAELLRDLSRARYGRPNARVARQIKRQLQ